MTLDVTTDPDIARSAPPLDELRRQVTQQVEAADDVTGPEPGLLMLEEIFEHQEARRVERASRIPAQRRRGAGSA